MIETINNENYYENGVQKSGKLYSDVTQVNFLNQDNSIVVYNQLGVHGTEIDPVTEIEVPTKRVLVNKVLKYTQEEMKALIESVARNFNADNTNLLLDEINLYVDDMILNDITNKPENYFGLTVDKWHKAV